MTTELKIQDDVFRLPLPKKSEVAYFDRGKPKDRAKGLALRVRKDGSRSWAFFYRFKLKQRKLVIGAASADPSGWTLAKARSKAHALRVMVDGGHDPAEAKHQSEADAKGSKTFKETMEAYLAVRKPKMKPSSYEGCERHLETQWEPFHRRAVHEITQDMVAGRLGEIERENGIVTRNRARSTLSAMFAWAIGERFSKQLKINPVTGTNKAEENKSRDRILTDDELVAIWKAKPDNHYGRIVGLLMLTGQRREEIGGLRWSEVQCMDDASKALLALPGDRTKNWRAHDVPLSEAALDILKEQEKVRDTDRDLVFGEGAGGYSGWSRSKDTLDSKCGVDKWTLHDLRRTAATRMADLGVQPHIIEAVLNHVSGHKAGVAGIYNRSSYATEKRGALNLWASHLKIILAKSEGANVVKMKKARG